MNHPSAPGAHVVPSYSNQGIIKTAIDKGSKNNNVETTSRTTTTLAHALLPDLPLLMHGSGDVFPEQVNPKSVAVLAQLTERYIASLVSAALDAHDIFTDGEVVGGGACLAIPPFASSAAATAAADSDSEDDNNYSAKEESDETIRKRKRSDKEKISKKFKQRKIDYWDQPLPAAAPGGGGEEDSSNEIDSSINESDSSDDDSEDEASQLTTLRNGERRKNSGFIGTVPLDLHANQRTRDYYVSAPTAMDARSFIFPICHDAVLYQRIKEMQANRRAISIDMMDHVLLQAVQEEGMNIGRMDVSDMWNSVLTSAVGAAAAAAEEEVSKGGSSSAAKDGDTKSKEEGEDKKSVEAGLVDSNVKASWPGMKPLSRGRLW
mmetsp:Transcript_10747/g.16201  ORF Transcript_10747/g.16201 Transcript_10747/m.16201 type:complete len:377 (-) Transcript_10747:227-1357(-)|eukprot:scaffold10109_cov144-Skeletonema_dohrnii-CCMP3373.AAC.1